MPGEIELPEVGQIGVVVKDIDRATQFYTKVLGLGPFQVIEWPRAEAMVGAEVRRFGMRLAFTALGNVSLELIQVLSGEPIHAEFVRRTGGGLHHLGFYVDDMEGWIKRFAKLGIGVLMRSTRGGGFAYLDTEALGGFIIELLEKPQA